MQKIESISPIFNSRRLVPRSQYKGPILRLTKKEQCLISAMEKEINDCQADLVKINNLHQNAKTESQRYSYNAIWIDLTIRIDILKKNIKDIKQNRLKIQKERMAAQKK